MLLRWGARLYLALSVAAVLWLGLSEGAIPLGLFLDRDAALTDLAAGVGAGAALVGLWQLGRLALASARSLEASIAATLGPLTAAEVVTLSILSGFSEELFFRGAVQTQLGIVPATVLFALLHLGPGREFRTWTLFALVAGAALGSLMLWRGNLLAPVVAHVGVNLVGLARLQRAAGRRPGCHS
jgi:membrane protease YdiL (CAAX protease family)